MTDIVDVKEPVNRSRRSWFIFSVVGFCLIASTAVSTLTGLGILTNNPLFDTLVTGLLSLATVCSVAYVGGSTIDYNGGIGNMFSRKGDTDPYRTASNTRPQSTFTGRFMQTASASDQLYDHRDGSFG